MNNWRDYDNLCLNCQRPLSPKACWGIGLDCWKKTGKGCPCHGGQPKYWWEKGQLLINCPRCAQENGQPEAIYMLWDKNASKEESK